MENVKKAMGRNDFKLWIYKHYLLPSQRFILTIHVLTETHLKLLDTLTYKAIKKWAGLPPSATNALIHMEEGLNIKSISELYTEANTVSHTRKRLKGDSNVNSVIFASIEKESEYKRKVSTVVEAEARFKVVVKSNTVADEIASFTRKEATNLTHKFNTGVSNFVKTVLCVARREHWENHVKSLAVQGQYLALAAAEKEDVVWKRFMYKMNQGTLKFLLND